MKFLPLIATAILLSSSTSFAAAKPVECVSANGNTLRWNEKYGELTVADRSGESVIYQDGLVLGSTKYIETLPGMYVTQIVFGDEEPTQVFAEIQTLDNGTKQIVIKVSPLKNQAFRCN